MSGALVAGLRTARRTWSTSLVAAVLLVGSYFAAVLAHGALYGYDFFGEPAPSDAADASVALLLLGWFVVAVYGVTLFYGVVAVMVRQDVPVRVALRRAVAGLWRDVWWAMPAMVVSVVAVIFVVPGPFVVAPFAMLGVARVNRVRLRAGAVARSYGRLLVVALVPTGLVLFVWVGGFVIGDAPSPPTWLAGLLCTAIAALSFAAMAFTAGAAAALVEAVEMRPVEWAPPLSPGSWAPPVPVRPWTPSPPVVRHPFPKARIAWISLLVVGGGTLMIAGLSTMGDPYPLSRNGVVLDTNGLQAVNAVCPNDRLLRVELRTQGDIDQPGTVLWRVEGDVPLPRRLVIGQPVDGMTTTKVLGVVEGDTPLELVVETGELGSSYPLEFTVAGLRPNEIVSDQGTFRTFDEFDRAAKDAVPCGDPLDTARDRSVMRGFLLVISVLLLGAGVFAVVDVMGVRRRSRATMQ